MTPEDTQIALLALESHFITGSLDSDKFLHLSTILTKRPEDFWPAYFLVFNPPSEEAKELLAKVGPRARLSALAAFDGKALFYPDRLRPVRRR